MSNDSKTATLEHMRLVSVILSKVICELLHRDEIHDAGKLQPEEKDIFDKFTPKLKDSTYGSDEYKGFLKAMKPALDHHYATNRHHPEFFDGGIKDMNLVDLIEMLCDWLAATQRHDDGDLMKSIEINQNRFGYGDEMKAVFENTARWLQGGELVYKRKVMP